MSRIIKIAIGFGVLIIFCLLLFWGWYSVMKPSIYTNTSGAAVIKQLQTLNKYETASFTIEKVIDAGTTGNRFEELLYGDRILLIAHGQIIAGFDLSKLQENDIQVSGSTVRLTMPPPQILHTKLDPEKTRVYDRRQGLLSRGDKDLESEARLAAERSLQEAACQGNILDEASKNARTQLTALLKTLNFTTVIIDVPQSGC